MKTYQTLIGITLLFLHAHGNAASFDCAKASSPTEKMICQNPNISKLDDRLSAAYKEAKKTNPSIVD